MRREPTAVRPVRLSEQGYRPSGPGRRCWMTRFGGTLPLVLPADIGAGGGARVPR